MTIWVAPMHVHNGSLWAGTKITLSTTTIITLNKYQKQILSLTDKDDSSVVEYLI